MRAGRGHLQAAIAQHEVEVGLVEVDEAVDGRHANVQVGVVALEGLHLRQQPERRERRERRQLHDPAPAGLADLPHAGIQPVDPRRHDAQQRAAAARELDVPGAAREERRAELVLEPLDLPAHRRLREVQLIGRLAEAEAPRHGLEGPQAAERKGPLAYRIHIKSASMRAADFIGSEAGKRR